MAVLSFDGVLLERKNILSCSIRFEQINAGVFSDCEHGLFFVLEKVDLLEADPGVNLDVLNVIIDSCVIKTLNSAILRITLSDLHDLN
jgi:hypothetical protein